MRCLQGEAWALLSERPSVPEERRGGAELTAPREVPTNRMKQAEASIFWSLSATELPRSCSTPTSMPLPRLILNIC